MHFVFIFILNLNSIFKKDLVELFAELVFGLRMLIISSKSLHAKMTKSIMHSKLSFYHSTPIGRILNRFTRDINAVEAQLHSSFLIFIRLTLAWLNSFVLTSYSNPWVLVAIVPIGVVYILILVVFRP